MGALNWNPAITKHNQRLYMKWQAEQAKNDGDDGGAANANFNQSRVSGAGSKKIVDLNWDDGDTLADNATAPQFLINDILEIDSHGILAGASMAFKTFADLRMVYSVCTGADFFGHTVFNTGKVLYVCGEGKGALSRRLKALKLTESDFKGNLLVLRQSIRIDNKSDMARLRKAILEIDPVFVVFDTFASLISETDENSPSAVGNALRLIKETCRNGRASSLIVHHYGKDATKGMRGASNFVNDVDFAFDMVRATGSMITTLSCKKMKDGEGFEDIHMEAEVVDLGIVRQDGKPTTSLVLKPTFDKPSVKGKADKKLSERDRDVLTELYNALNQQGMPPTDAIKALFPDSPHKLPQQDCTSRQMAGFCP